MALRRELGPGAHPLFDLAAAMERDGYDRDDPIRAVFALLGDRWSTLIVAVLGAAPIRAGGLRRVIGILSSEGDISQRMLTLKLRALERNGLVLRSVSPDVPPRVDYALTETGASLAAEITRLMNWIRLHQGKIIEARARFDAGT